MILWILSVFSFLNPLLLFCKCQQEDKSLLGLMPLNNKYGSTHMLLFKWHIKILDELKI